jgi:hypothetical protein
MPATSANHAAAVIEATRASGAIIQINPEGFLEILRKSESPLVIAANGGIFGKKFDYLTSYKGLCFFTRSSEELQLPTRAEMIPAKKIWVPGTF